MESEDYDLLIEQYTSSRHALSIKKRQDYATYSDVLSNFKRMGSIITGSSLDELFLTNPEMAFNLLMVYMKLDRIINLLLIKKPNVNEGIEDSFEDAANYLDLSYALFVELKAQEDFDNSE
jgi:hypothetical protein